MKISHDQVDWLNLFKKKLTQVQKDLNFYKNILGKFIAKNIVLLKLNSRDDITQEDSTVMITADIAMIADITVDAVIMDDASITNDSCA